MELRYNVHVQNKGWLYNEDDPTNWPKDGAYAGTRGDSLRIEAVKIVLTDSAGKAVTGYSVQYRGHVQNVGDLPDTIQSLSEKSFESCVNLQAINIPKYIRSIPASCFSSCSKLKTVTIPPEASLQTIDECSFFDTKLKTMAIPATVTTIKNSAFRECRQLEAVTFTANSQLKTIGDNAFFYCPLTEINLPATVTAIGEKAFIANKLTKVTFNNPNGTTLTIGKDAFSGSPQIPSQNPITEITLPAGVSLLVDPQAADATMGLYGTAFKNFYESTEVDDNNCAGGTFVYDAAK